ncbi:uncharacterized protein LOC131939012 [Physella acuta]|uniref:uncharacterized protein LOC131939012 n=1 Tax=Physella acuta TaxID=109671 RepID=UPI0027DD34DC|nr:uncharacterized protein LOC131939012 [Physella acuta]
MKHKIKKTHIATADVIDLRDSNERYARTLNKPSNTFNLTEQLPNDVLLHIFSFLDFKDLTRLAYVCTSWRNLINTSPGLWREMYLKLTCRLHSAQNVRTYWYASRFGSYLRELIIHCLHHKNNFCKNMAVCVRKMLLNLHATSLTSLNIFGVKLFGVSSPIMMSLASILTRFLTRNPCLQHFKMPLALWRVTAGKKVLNTVLTVCKGTLESLMIHGFFLPPKFGQKPADFDQLTNGILSLKNLTKLGIDYFILNDVFINALSKSNTKLKRLKMFDMDVRCTVPKVTHNSWRNLTVASPEMQVAFFGYSVPDVMIAKLDSILPIYDIRVGVVGFGPRNRTSMSAVLKHITENFSGTLVKLQLDIDTTDRIDTAFLRLVRQSKHLIRVTVSARFTNSKIKKTVLNVVRERRRRLHLETLPENTSKRARKTSVNGQGSSTPDAAAPRDGI